MTYDDYNVQNFIYKEGASFDVAMEMVSNNQNEGVIPLIVDLMV